MIDFAPARTGTITATFNGRALYSRYDPQMEANRFLDTEIGESLPHTIVVLGAGLGYLCRAVRTRFPRARLIAVHYSRQLHEHRIASADEQWVDGDTLPPTGFLERVLSAEDTDGLVVVSWEPCARAFTQTATAVLAGLRDVLDRNAASLATEGTFGRRWLRNGIRNAASMRLTIPSENIPRTHRFAVVIAASGPSLVLSLEVLRNRPAGVKLWALPSSISVLLNAGCTPDLVITTDAGYYAAEHLKPLHEDRIPVAAPLSAALGGLERRCPVLILDQGSWFERSLLEATGLPSIALPPHGTVAGSAWLLARALGAASVSYAGLDLCNDDLLSHPRGHGFDDLLWPRASRLEPMHHILFNRNILPTTPVAGSRRARTSRAMRTYAAWFRRAAHPTPACRVRPSPVDLAIPPCDRLWPDTTGPDPVQLIYDTVEFASAADRIASIRRCIHGWLTELDRLPQALAGSPPDRDRREHRVCDIARTIDTAGYLTLVRAARVQPASAPEGDRTGDRTAAEDLEAKTRTFLGDARRGLSSLFLMLDGIEASR